MLFKIFDKLFTDVEVEESKKEEAQSRKPEEAQYYEPDEYYVDIVHKGTMFEKKVITFEERKKTCISSNAGLYVAEILLLEYCNDGDYPYPKKGYPAFWWFEYGIWDVTKMLKQLENRGFIRFGNEVESLSGLTGKELKQILEEKKLSKSGEKRELIKRIDDNFKCEELKSLGVKRYYRLTEKGKTELSENLYVVFLHKYPGKESEGGLNVWTINKLLGSGEKSNWRKVVDDYETMKNEKQRKRLEKNKVFDEKSWNAVQKRNQKWKMQWDKKRM